MLSQIAYIAKVIPKLNLSDSLFYLCILARRQSLQPIRVLCCFKNLDHRKFISSRQIKKIVYLI